MTGKGTLPPSGDMAPQAPLLDLGTQLAAGGRIVVHADCQEAVWVAAAAAFANPDREHLEVDGDGDLLEGLALELDRQERDRRNRLRAARRARTKMRRMSVANRMVYMWTLTYAVEPDSRDDVIRDLGRFFKRLARVLGNTLPRIAVVERGTESGRLHAHFVTSERIPWDLMGEVWGHGYVLYRDYTKQHGKGAAAARRAASYCAKYAAKDLEDGLHGRQAYLVSEGLTTGRRIVRFLDSSEALAFAVMVLQGGEDALLSCSDEWDDHDGPPAWWFGVP